MYRGDLSRYGHTPGAALDAAAAKRLKAAWQVEMSGAVNGTPAVAGGVVVAASGGGGVAAYHLNTGGEIVPVGPLLAVPGAAANWGTPVIPLSPAAPTFPPPPPQGRPARGAPGPRHN